MQVSFRVLSPLLSSFLLVSPGVAKPPIPTPADAPIVGELDPFLLGRLLDGQPLGKDAGIKDLQGDEEFEALVEKHGLQLFGGPMLGDLSERGGAVWLRTAKPAKVELLIDGKVVAAGATEL